MRAPLVRIVAIALTASSLLIAVPAVACGPYRSFTAAERIEMSQDAVRDAAVAYAEALATGDKAAQERAWAALVLQREYLADLRAAHKAQLARR